LRAWCKTIVTTSFYIRSYNGFAPSTRYRLSVEVMGKSKHIFCKCRHGDYKCLLNKISHTTTCLAQLFCLEIVRVTMYSILNKKLKTAPLLSGHRRRQNTVPDCLCGGNKCLLIKRTKEHMLDICLFNIGESFQTTQSRCLYL